MSVIDSRSDLVVPAQVSWLSIYNPGLGKSEDTLKDQIFYFYSRKARYRRRQSVSRLSQLNTDEEENYQLRQLGLAQGTIQFANAFSQGQSVDFVDTERTRLIFKELEPGWWIVTVCLSALQLRILPHKLKCIDLTQLPGSETSGASTTPADQFRGVEYSAREISPSWLLLCQLVRAYHLFLLIHGPSFDNLNQKLGRHRFCPLLERYWTKFIREWNVLLHGNPAIECLNGIKLAASGELGFGVGEEDWGSGEREVLEDFVRRTDGLVDLIVSRMGSPIAKHKKKHDQSDSKRPSSWLDSGSMLSSDDGLIFSGVNTLSRQSLCSLAHWLERIYLSGKDAYGVRNNPNSQSRERGSSKHKRRSQLHRKKMAEMQAQGSQEVEAVSKTDSSSNQPKEMNEAGTRVPPPIFRAESNSEHQLEHSKQRSKKDNEASSEGKDGGNSSSIYKYLTLGYGSAWSFTDRDSPARQHEPKITEVSKHSVLETSSQGVKHVQGEPTGDKSRGMMDEPKFLIGLLGDLEEKEKLNSSDDESELPARTLPRTIWAQVASNEVLNESMEEAQQSPWKRFRVVIYASQPFIFALLFELDSPLLAVPAFYRSLHHQLGPLTKPLLASTDPRKRESSMDPNVTETSKTTTQPIYDLVFDPSLWTIQSTIPYIPSLESNFSDLTEAWTRLEAMSVHVQIVTLLFYRQDREPEFDATCKTSKDWWVVWIRLPKEGDESEMMERKGQSREAFLVRKASTPKAGSKLSHQRLGSTRDSTSGREWSPARLVEGIGVDTRKYVEQLLSLNR